MSEYSSTNLLQYYAGKPPAHLIHNPGFKKMIDTRIWDIVTSQGGGGGGGGGLSLQFMWVVGGAANFSSPTPPGNGATSFTSSSLIGKIPIVSRNGMVQMGINPANGDTYYTFNSATGAITFSSAIATGEEITIQA